MTTVFAESGYSLLSRQLHGRVPRPDNSVPINFSFSTIVILLIKYNCCPWMQRKPFL
uniref:Uncharacterized protein n=1 Tax=Arundo donax TaxID=35708 RepID=A0A0A9B063_ARUDO